MARVFVAVGSNIDPMENVPKAIRLLSGRARICAISTFYRTEPVGAPGSAPFVNGVIELETDIPPRELKIGVLREIERELGRKRIADKNAPRTIDLDLLLYDEKAIRSEDLTIPDPEVVARPFLAIPLCELAPELILPGIGRPVREIALELGFHPLQRLDHFSESLRKEITHERAARGAIIPGVNYGNRRRSQSGGAR